VQRLPAAWTPMQRPLLSIWPGSDIYRIAANAQYLTCRSHMWADYMNRFVCSGRLGKRQKEQTGEEDTAALEIPSFWLRDIILGNWPTWCINSSMCLFLFITLYMFRAHSAYHQERQIVPIQPLVMMSTVCSKRVESYK